MMRVITLPVCLVLAALFLFVPAAAAPIHHAAASGDVARVTRLLRANPKLVDAKVWTGDWEDGWTPLHFSVYSGNVAVTRLLISKRARVNARDSHGSTPLYYADTKPMVEMLLAQGASVRTKNLEGYTPMAYAVAGNNGSLARTLKAKGAPITNIHEAAYFGEVRLLKRFLDRNRNLLNKQEPHDRETPLYIAAREGHAQVAKLLLERHADVEICAFEGETPLIAAAGNGHLEVVKLLIAHGADIDAIAPIATVSPLYMAVMRGHLDVAELLLSKGAKPNVAMGIGNSKYWRTPLDVATDQKNQKMIDLLKKYGAK
jgi:ankyrin repeat protein